MRTLTPTRRIAATLALLLHLLVVGAGSVADARLHAAASGDGVAHIEDQSRPACAPKHHEQFCHLCETLHSLDFFPRAAPILALGDVTPDTIQPTTSAPIPFVAAPPLGPRGPPAA